LGADGRRGAARVLFAALLAGFVLVRPCLAEPREQTPEEYAETVGYWLLGAVPGLGSSNAHFFVLVHASAGNDDELAVTEAMWSFLAQYFFEEGDEVTVLPYAHYPADVPLDTVTAAYDHGSGTDKVRGLFPKHILPGQPPGSDPLKAELAVLKHIESQGLKAKQYCILLNLAGHKGQDRWVKSGPQDYFPQSPEQARERTALLRSLAGGADVSAPGSPYAFLMKPGGELQYVYVEARFTDNYESLPPVPGLRRDRWPGTQFRGLRTPVCDGRSVEFMWDRFAGPPEPRGYGLYVGDSRQAVVEALKGCCATPHVCRLEVTDARPKPELRDNNILVKRVPLSDIRADALHPVRGGRLFAQASVLKPDGEEPAEGVRDFVVPAPTPREQASGRVATLFFLLLGVTFLLWLVTLGIERTLTWGAVMFRLPIRGGRGLAVQSTVIDQPSAERPRAILLRAPTQHPQLVERRLASLCVGPRSAIPPFRPQVLLVPVKGVVAKVNDGSRLLLRNGAENTIDLVVTDAEGAQLKATVHVDDFWKKHGVKVAALAVSFGLTIVVGLIWLVLFALQH